MGKNFVQQFRVKVGQTSLRSTASATDVAFFNADGTPLTLGTPAPAAANADVTVANATDLPTAIALANANKATINSLQAKLRTAGFLHT